MGTVVQKKGKGEESSDNPPGVPAEKERHIQLVWTVTLGRRACNSQSQRVLSRRGDKIEGKPFATYPRIRTTFPETNQRGKARKPKPYRKKFSRVINESASLKRGGSSNLSQPTRIRGI